MVRGTGQDQGLEAGEGACVLSHRWFLWAGACRQGCQGWDSGSDGVLGSHDELQPLGEVGPKKGAPARQQGRTCWRSQVQRSGTHGLSRQVPWKRRLSTSLGLWVRGQ